MFQRRWAFFMISSLVGCLILTLGCGEKRFRVATGSGTSGQEAGLGTEIEDSRGPTDQSGATTDSSFGETALGVASEGGESSGQEPVMFAHEASSPPTGEDPRFMTEGQLPDTDASAESQGVPGSPIAQQGGESRNGQSGALASGADSETQTSKSPSNETPSQSIFGGPPSRDDHIMAQSGGSSDQSPPGEVNHNREPEGMD